VLLQNQRVIINASCLYMLKEIQTAFVFPGQGSQRVGMGQKIYNNYRVAQLTFEEANGVLGRDITSICFSGPKDILDATTNTQPAIITTSIAALRVLEEEGRIPDQVAGHSLGEYSALVAAKALEFSDSLRIIQARANLMEAAGLENPGGMAALLGLSIDTVQEICHLSGAQIANINTEKQIVITGKKESIIHASELAKDNQGKVINLNVSIAGHSPLMQSAKYGLSEVLQTVNLQNPKVPFVANVTGSYIQEADGVRQGLVNQITGSVLWFHTIKTMIENGVTRFVEVGPGKVLSGLIRNINSTVLTEPTNV